jgi:hypothetical protein
LFLFQAQAGSENLEPSFRFSLRKLKALPALGLTRPCTTQLKQGKLQPNRFFARLLGCSFALLSIGVLRSRGKAGLYPALPWQHGTRKGKPRCFNSPSTKVGGQNLRMSSGETGSFRKEGPTEQVSLNFFLLNLYRPLGEPDLTKAPAFFLRSSSLNHARCQR